MRWSQLPPGAPVALASYAFVAWLAACGARTELPGIAEPDDAGSVGGSAGDASAQGGSGGAGASGGTAGASASGGSGGSSTSPACAPGEGPVPLAEGYVWPYGIALLDDHVFFSLYDGQGALMRVRKTGGEPDVVIDDLDYPSGVAADTTGVYVAVSGEGRILRTTPDGSSLDVLASGQNGPSDVAVDESLVVWTNYVGDQIRSVAKEGGSVTTLAWTASSPYRLALGPTNVYWGEFTDGVWSVPKAGGEVEALAEGEPRSLATSAGWLYYTEPDTGSVRRMPLGGGEVEVLYEGDGFSDGLAVDGSHVYATFAEGMIVRVPKAGGPVEVVATGQAGPTHVVLDDECVYWTNTGDGLPAVGSVMRAPKAL